MLFNSYEFIFIFLPTTLIVFFKIGNSGHTRSTLGWLVLASLFFYGWWNPIYVLLLAGSILTNYTLGTFLSSPIIPPARRKLILGFGIAGNLLTLGYYKYFDFFITIANPVLNTQFQPAHLLLPLAISFFTFQQISFLIDTYRQELTARDFLQYCFFVTFFPQLIAGPLVRHNEFFKQLDEKFIGRLEIKNIAVGLTIFFIGLFKKVVLADSLAKAANRIFEQTNAELIRSNIFRSMVWNPGIHFSNLF